MREERDRGGPLLVQPRGAVLVSTDGMLACARRLEAVREALESASLDVVVIAEEARYASTRSAAIASGMAVPAVMPTAEALSVAVRDAADRARRLHLGLRTAAERYTDAERATLGQAEAGAALLAGLLGPALRSLIGMGLLVAGVSAVTGAVLDALPGDVRGTAGSAFERWMREHPELVTSPAFATMVRAVSGAADDAAGAVVGLPPTLLAVLGPQGLGLLGTATSAVGTVGAARMLGLLRESPVSVQRRATVAVASAPSGTAERLARVPEGEQVRIERYRVAGRPDRFMVYVGPTETFSPARTDEPWDLSSNVGGVAGIGAASVRGTELAMRDAGITSKSEVQLVGFSQGGLVAARVAESPQWNVVGLETHGAPTGAIALDPAIRGMSIEHREDPVPALGGDPVGDGRMRVRRDAFSPGDMPTDEIVPAHQRRGYAATAELIDAASSPEVRAETRAMTDFTREYAEAEGAQITEYRYRAERVDAGLDRLAPPLERHPMERPPGERALATSRDR